MLSSCYQFLLKSFSELHMCVGLAVIHKKKSKIRPVTGFSANVAEHNENFKGNGQLNNYIC